MFFNDSLVLGRQPHDGIVLPDDGVTWLLNLNFRGVVAAPIPSPYAEVGSIFSTQLDGQLSINNDLIVPAQATPVWGDLGYYAEKNGGGSFARVAGRAFFFSFTGNPTNTPFLFSWHTSTTLGNASDSNTVAAVIFEGGGQIRILDGAAYFISPTTWTNGVREDWCMVHRPTGVLFFKLIAGNWSLIVPGVIGTTTPLYPAMKTHTGAFSQHLGRVRDLAAPFDSQNGILTFNVTADGQTLGTELLTNAAFTAWTGDNPDGWTQEAEDANHVVCEVATGQNHSNCGTPGGGMANMWWNGSGLPARKDLSQSALVVGSIVEGQLTVNTLTTGTASWYFGNTLLRVLNAVGTFRAIGKVTAVGTFQMFASAAVDITFDNPSGKQLTLSAQQTAAAETTLDLEFTAPVSPVAGHQIGFWYRMPSAGDEFVNGYYATITRNAANTGWEAAITRYVAGVTTSVIAAQAIGVGVGVDMLRVTVIGNTHYLFTRTGTTVSARTSGVSANFNTAVLCSYLYGAGFTFGAFRAVPYQNGAWNAELNKS